MHSTVLECVGIYKRYSEGPQTVEVLRGVNLKIEAAQHIAIVGASGSGKSTLLNVLGGLDKPDSGEVLILDTKFSACNENRRGEIRNKNLGFVYQFHHLLAEFTALENVAMPLLIGGVKKNLARARARDLLAAVGLSERVEHKPPELSGGERQRVAIARALANSPACVLMDEPTGNLDSDNADAIQQLMKTLSESMQTSFIVVTHDMNLAKRMDTIYKLDHGVLARVL